tara:strand:- start:217 stop:399 length:183 start_codon:yes stop_codon:yes gene_type:complete
MEISAKWQGCSLDQMYEFDSVELAVIQKAVSYYTSQTTDELEVCKAINLKTHIMLNTGYD